ncbi:uncharacterized protein METZ01_LOCUS358754, partial [marine metagenome]
VNGFKYQKRLQILFYIGSYFKSVIYMAPWNNVHYHASRFVIK